MKILHVSSALSWRGGEQQIAYLMEELRGLGEESEVMCPEGTPLHQHAQAAGFITHPYQKRGSLNLRASAQLKTLCRERALDLVHLHDSHAHNIGFLASLLLGNTTPMVVSRRLDFPLRGLLSRWKYNHPRIKLILCVSAAILRIHAPAIRDQGRLRIVHSGIDFSRFASTKRGSTGMLRSEYAIPNGVWLIGNVAALAPHKDYFTFLRTASLLLAAGLQAKFLLIGEGSLRQELEHYAKELGIAEQVIFTGFRDDIPQILPELDVFLFSSKTEGLGTSVIDALACGLPVVATRAGGVPEIITHESNGLLAEVGDAEGLAAAVQRLLEDEALRKRLSAAARQSVQAFSKEATARKTLAAYQEVLAEPLNKKGAAVR